MDDYCRKWENSDTYKEKKKLNACYSIPQRQPLSTLIKYAFFSFSALSYPPLSLISFLPFPSFSSFLPSI